MTTDKGLMVWLPLTDANHCENLGLVGKLTCTTTPTLVDGGKLGKCLSTGAYLMSAELTAKVFNNNHLTIAFWVYIDAATGASTPCSAFIGNWEMNANNNRKFMVMLYPTVNDLHYSWMNDAANIVFIHDVVKDVLPSYKWTHVAITYENPTAIIYINGVEVRRDTGVSNSSTFAYTTPIIENNAGRRINDFRIYSYALSPQEIKELSRGKVGHWLGDGNGFHIPNILTYTPENFSYLAANGSYTNTTEGDTRKCTVTTTSTSWHYSYYNLGTAIIDALTANTKYTVSFSFKSDNTYNIGIDIKRGDAKYSLSSISSVEYNASMVGKWKRLAATLTTNTLANRANSNTQVLYFSGFNKVGTYYIKDIMFLKGEADSCYTTSTSQAFLSDISGFGRHGNITGEITLSSDTKRYDKSLNFSTSDGRAYASIVLPISNSPSAMTIAFWIKPNSASVSLYRLCFSFNNGMGYWLSINTEDAKVWFHLGPTLYVKSSNGTLDSNWHHIAMVWNGSLYQFYIDGIADTTTCKSAKNYTLNIVAPLISTFIIGNNYPLAYYDGKLFKDYLSDIRLYATALSADDVKELYSLGH